MKDTLHFKKRRTTWTMDQTGNPVTDIYVFHSFGCNRHKDEDSSVIAQPMFVFKKERPCKRPAEDPVHKTENVPSGSRKRARTSYFSFQSSDSESYRETVGSKKQARTSSFIIIPSFPPSQPDKAEYIMSHLKKKRTRILLNILENVCFVVKKNNVFMTSGLSEDYVEVKTTEQDLPTSNNRQREVLRPAKLQPPQATTYKTEKKRIDENCLEENHETDNQVKYNAPSRVRVLIVAAIKFRSCKKVLKYPKSAFEQATGLGFFPMSEDTYAWIDISKKLPHPLQISSSGTTHNRLVKDRTVSESEHSNFVFGENIVERVLKPEKSPELQSKDISEKEPICAPDFHTIPPWATPHFAKGSTLAESAAAYLSSKTAQRYFLEEIEITTGEEEEHNVLQINCRLFLFNKALLCWTERGSGCLRLNDTSSNQHEMLQSRLVMRNQGSMRLILNTRLWSQMVIERANRKSVCITATDLEDGSVKVFLIQASTKDIESLYAAIHHRLVAQRNFTKQECGVNQVEYKLDVQPISCDSDDEENEKKSPGSNNRSEHSPWIRRQPVVCS
ncbi:ran-binding protein 3-like [Thamnophis elegans]|uniref:ran-binding protein 3-like n=1 Tax=Thamnophis elegans TaxID=35005 RepID=UPI0013777869|nr:ran-binding protein 3-like [Thamnophis elegans]